jgi:ATP-dependent Lon protease
MNNSDKSQLSISLTNEVLEDIIQKANALSVDPEVYIEALISKNKEISFESGEHTPIQLDHLSDPYGTFETEEVQNFAESSSNDREEEQENQAEPDLFDKSIFTPSVQEAMEKFLEQNESEEEKRIRIVQRILARGRFRKACPLPDPECFTTLLDLFPNFRDVTLKIRSLAIMCRMGTGPARIAPLLLVGPPGVGKSVYLKKLAALLGTKITFLDCPSQTNSSWLTGLSFTFKSGMLGHVAKSLCFGEVINPIFVLDEIEKSQTSTENGNILQILHGLLEPITAKEFVEDGLGPEFPLDASWITWVATANSLDSIPESLLSRFTIFEIKPPTQEEMVTSIIPSIFDSIRENMPLRDRLDVLSVEVRELLATCSPREARKFLEEGIEMAATRSYERSTASTEMVRVEPQDIHFTSKISRKREPLGFV